MTIQDCGVIELLQQWYRQECDGDWEKSYGVRIETLDNPGWWVEIDLVGTRWSNLVVERQIVSRSELDWFQYEVHDGKFIGGGGLGKLEQVIAMFLSLVGHPTSGRDA